MQPLAAPSFRMQLFLPTIAQLDFLGGVAGVVASIVISFVVITLIASYYRFQKIVQMAEETRPEEMGVTASEVLRVQFARYLSRCARRGTSFSIALIHVGNQDIHVESGSPVIMAIKQAARRKDVTCVHDEKTAVLIAELEPEDAVSILSRITSHIAQNGSGISHEELRVGIASYPGHGLSSKELMRVAQEGLSLSNGEIPIIMPEIVDADEEEGEAEELEEELETDVDEKISDAEFEAEMERLGDDSSKNWKDRRKNIMLDELTGVLKPSAVSAYMQRMMSEIRRKKKKAALFCIGVNNMAHIARFHGRDAAHDMLIGVSKILQDNLRANDLIGRHEKYGFIILLECTFEEAEAIGKRINTLVQNAEITSDTKKLKTTVTIGVSTYPAHGRNLHHLYTAGQKVLDHSRTNDIRGYVVFDPEIHDKVAAKPLKNIKSVKA